jgi:hypothetical protein
MSGDLARKINNRLLVRKKQPLSVYEKVGWASYAQSISNLNEMCRSDRLAHLLAEDLEIRSKGGNKQNKQNPQEKNKNNNNNSQGKGKKQIKEKK